MCMATILQVNKKFCELKVGNIGIVEKAQETRFCMSPSKPYIVVHLFSIVL